MILISLFTIILASFFIRIVNLDYNSPFSDEAIYVVIGKMGVFEGDWKTLVPFEWMAGAPYFYPSVSALAFEFGGIEASRFVNVILFILTTFLIYRLTYLLREGSEKDKGLAGLVAAAITAGSSVGFYVSRLATYDMPSFFFLTLGLYFFALAEQSRILPGRKYILSAIFLLIAFLFKYIVAIYIPFLLVFSYLRGKTKYRKRATLIYFALPVVATLLFFGVSQFNNLSIYIGEQSALELKSPLGEILKLFVNESILVLPFWVIGSFGFFRNRKVKAWALLTMFSGIIVFFHLLTQRLHTFDKHMFLSIGSLAVAAGLGISFLLESTRKQEKRKIYTKVLILAILICWVYSFVDSQQYNRAWVNAYPVMDFVEANSRPKDIVISEIGAITQLGLYPKTSPESVFTFDWIYYDDLEGKEALVHGVNDGYFDTIILSSQNDAKSDMNFEMHKLVVESRDFNRIYSNVYGDDHFEVYKRNY